MAFSNIDLTTEDGARSAAEIGGLACFIAAALSILGAVLIAGVLGGTAAPAAWTFAIGAGIEAVLFAIAGFRLRAGRGLVWGSVAAAVITLELIGKMLAFSVIGIAINIPLLLAMLGGVRGAWALRRGKFDDGEAAAIFE